MRAWNDNGDLLSHVSRVAELIDRPSFKQGYPGPGKEEYLRRGQEYQDDLEAYKKNAQEWMRKYATGGNADAQEEPQWPKGDVSVDEGAKNLLEAMEGGGEGEDESVGNVG